MFSEYCLDISKCLPYIRCMPIGASHRRRGGDNRRIVTPPHVPIKALRIVAGITLEALAEEIANITGTNRPATGTLSAIESGLRGASTEMLRAIEKAYGLEAGMVTTDYRARTAAPAKEQGKAQAHKRCS